MKAIGILLILFGLPMLIIPIVGIPMIIVGFIVILSSIGSSNAEKTANATARALAEVQTRRESSATPVERDTPKMGDTAWATLVRYDDDIKAAMDELSELGPTAQAKFREVYVVLNDKTKIPRIVADIKADFA